MSKQPNAKATYRHWLSERMDEALTNQVNRLRHAKDVKHVRLMADAHLANDVCVGCVLATSELIYPAAIGGDIGCGMLAIGFDVQASVITADNAQKILAELDELVPVIKHRQAQTYTLTEQLSSSVLTARALKDGALQFGTIGRGNHFLELQSCYQTGQLWIMVHTGSRAMGPLIRDHHLAGAQGKSAGIGYLNANTEQGQALINDMAWARAYARANRKEIMDKVAGILHRNFSANVDTHSMIHCDHNHLEPLLSNKGNLLVHRKGASQVTKGQMAVIPGSMGSDSFHVEGKGNTDALHSSSHGAGRCMSRQLARNTITPDNLERQIDGVFYQRQKLARLTEEAPSSYKNIDSVMKAQKALVKVKRRLAPVLNYKGT